MIIWQDFILDDVLGPLLVFPEDVGPASSISCREERLGGPDARNGASGNNGVQGTSIQETRQEQRLARMAGPSSHDSAQVDRMSAGSNRACLEQRQTGGEK